MAVVRLPDHFGPRGLAALDAALTRLRPDRILIQYVPHAYGYKAMNLPFAAWVAARARRIAPVWVMFHEVLFPFAWRPPAHAVLGAVTGVMARLVAEAADRVFVSIPTWADWVRRVCPRSQPAEWLPVPSNLPTNRGIIGVRDWGAGDRVAIGHFGTFGYSVTTLLESIADRLLADRADRVFVFIGRGGEGFRNVFVGRHPGLAGQVVATGGLPSADAAARLARCDLLVQPYPDGVSCRRGSVMAGLGLGLPVVSNLGFLSEPFWATEPGVRLALTPDPAAVAAAAEAVLALPPARRADLGAAGTALYRERFSLENTVTRLRACL